MKNQTVSVNNFVCRQVEGSGKSYSPIYSFDEIAQHAENQLNNGHFISGYRDGVIIVSAGEKIAQQFVCPLVRIKTDTPLTAKYISRRGNEEAVIQIRAHKGKLLYASKVELILYSHSVLAENDEHSTGADWELIAFHAIPEGVTKLPMQPTTMIRNQLNMEGGTAAQYSSEEWAEAVLFWQNYAALEK
ncbi:DUF3228 family protein [Candidatus Neomarinimicrobiota bacterium]